MYRALIVEDDRSAADVLRDHLARFGAEAGVSFSVEVVGSALEFLDGRHVADVIFMDIAMPGINGMEAAEILRQTDSETPLIFVTDLAQYAVRGYQVDALDFMVKPVEYGDFALRMRRALRVMRRRAGHTLTIPTTDGMRIFSDVELVYVETYRHDLYYHLVGEAEPFHVRGSLTKVAEGLDPARFCRISASHLVNMAQVSLARTTTLIMCDGTELAISRSRRREVQEALARFAGGSI